jgi:hypothetical protein
VPKLTHILRAERWKSAGVSDCLVLAARLGLLNTTASQLHFGKTPFSSSSTPSRLSRRCWSLMNLLAIPVIVSLRVAIILAAIPLAAIPLAAIPLAAIPLVASCSVTGFIIAILIDIVLYKFPLSLPLRELC